MSSNHIYQALIHELISKNCITPKRKLNPMLQKDQFVKSRNLNTLYNEITKITSFLPDSATLIQRIYCVYNNIISAPKCKMCSNAPKFDKFTTGHSIYCSSTCYFSDPARTPSGIHSLSDSAKTTSFLKGVATRKANGTYTTSISTRSKQSISAKRKTCLERHGVENPGILGGRSSKAATEYIISFLSKNNIDPNRCFYGDKSCGRNEFFQMIEVPYAPKLKYTLYDLVVFETEHDASTKDINKISIILEYSGPFHYKESESQHKLLESATPYPNSVTIKQSIEYDRAKVDHFRGKGITYITYWERTQETEVVIT